MAERQLVLALDVAAEDDLPRAVAFYEAALDITRTTDLDHGEIRLGFREVCLVVSAKPLQEEFYEKGRTPRLQIQVDDVRKSVRHFLDCGARLARDKDGQSSAIPESATYVEVVDPFGHLWSFIKRRD